MAALPKNADGFATKALIVFAGVFLTALLGFFAWLAIAVGEIRVKVAETKGTVTSLVEARAQERTAPVNTNIERNTRRIEQLEGARQ